MKAETIVKAVNAACEAIGCGSEWADDEIGSMVSEVRRGNHHSPDSAHAVVRPGQDFGQLSDAQAGAVCIAMVLCSALAKLPDLEAPTQPVEESPAEEQPAE